MAGSGRISTRLKVVNRLSGIIPTFAGFDINPSNPQLMTDGDWTTESGEGVKQLSANGEWFIKFDMGSAYPVLVVAHMNAHRASGDGVIHCAIQRSDNGINYYDGGIGTLSRVSGDVYRSASPIFLYARYFQLFFYTENTSVTSVYHVKVAEIMAIQLI